MNQLLAQGLFQGICAVGPSPSQAEGAGRVREESGTSPELRGPEPGGGHRGGCFVCPLDSCACRQQSVLPSGAPVSDSRMLRERWRAAG